MGFNEQTDNRQTDGWKENSWTASWTDGWIISKHKASTAWCWWRHKIVL